MSRAVTTDARAESRRLFTVGTLVVCGLAGALAALNVQLAWMLLLGVLAAAAAYVFVGALGLIVLAPVCCCFALLTRFDEEYGLFVTDELRLSLIYLLMLASIVALLFCLPWRRTAEDPTAKSANGLLVVLIAFACTGLFAILFHRLFDARMPARSPLRELLAMGIVTLPICYGVLIPKVGLTKRQTLMCINAILALGTATGLIMVVFAILPGRVIGLLGWTQAAFGTLDLARGRTPLGHPNTVGAVLVVLLPISIVLAFRSRDARLRFAYMFSVPCLFAGILFTLSRSSVAVASVMTLITCGYLLLHRKRRIWASLGVAVAVLAVGIGLAGFLFSRYDFGRLWSRGYHESTSVERRSASFRTAFAVWQDYPLLGMGPGAFYPRLTVDPYWAPDGADNISSILYYRGHITAPHPHNAYAMLLAEWGVIGAGIYLIMLAIIGAALYTARGTPGTDPEDAGVIGALRLALAALLLMAMGDSLLQADIRPNIVFWVLIGLGMRYVVLVRQSDAVTCRTKAS